MRKNSGNGIDIIMEQFMEKIRNKCVENETKFCDTWYKRKEKVKLGSYAMKRVAAGAHHPTPL